MDLGPRADGQANGEAHAARDETVDFRRLVDAVTDYAILLLDPEGVIRSWNPGAQRIKGWTAEDVIGRHFSIFYREEELAAGKPGQILEQARQHGSVEDEGWRVRSDGSTFWAQVTISALKGTQDQVIGFVKITRDLTQRKVREQSAQRLALIDEQEAIGRDLLGKTVSSLFAVGLNLQGVMLEVGDERIQRQLENVINELDTLIGDVRRALYARMAAL